MNILEPIIKNHNGKPMVSSRIVAEQLGKQHKDVLSKIRDVLTEREFSPSEYKDSSGKINPELLLSKDGFILLCMNYQGYNEFKRAYIQKFNEMEEQLKLQTSELSPQLQLLINMELTQKEQARKIAEVNQKVDNIREIVALSPNGWREDCARLLSKMATAMGGFEHIQALRAESYKLLNERFGVDLQIRLVNKRRRMSEEGVCKSKRDKINHLDVIANDKKLIEGYLAIIKEMAVKYGAAISA